MKQSKFKGGTVLTTFRLPKEGYKAVRAKVNELLYQISIEMDVKSKNNVKPLPTSAKTTLSSKPIIDVTTYVCGCSINDGLFKRVQGCAIPRPHHRGY
jgi:hypothetical protein